MAEREFDVIVVGAGPAGEIAAGRVAEKSEQSVAIIERELVGGECSYYACMPSKALLRPAELLAEVRRVPGAREAVTGDIDVAVTLARRDEVIHDFDDSVQLPWLESRGIELFRGEASFEGERRLRVGDDTLVARKAVVVATGSGASLPPVDGLADAKPWNNREITTTKEVPGRLVILGGGVVGVEMAQAFASFGSEVTVIEAIDRLIANEEEFASELVENSLAERGVRILKQARASRVERSNGEVTVELEGGDPVVGDELVVAAGRRPHTTALGVEKLGLEPGKPIEVDDRMRSTAHPDWLYAVGDVNGRTLLTHMGKYQGRIAGDNIIGEDAPAIVDPKGPPRVIFTDPQVAAVGHTLRSAEEAGIDARAVDHPQDGTAGGSYIGKGAPGTARLVIDQGRSVLAGATFVGPEVADWLHAATIAVTAEVPLERLFHAIPSFPTRSEIWLQLLEKYGL